MAEATLPPVNPNDSVTRINDAKDRIIFTTLVRYDFSEAMGFAKKHSAGSSSDRLKYLRGLDWDDPRICDKAMECYINRVVGLINHDRDAAGKPRVHVSWGSPATDDKDNVIRPQIRVLVRNEEEPNEEYVLTYLADKHEKKMSAETMAELERLRDIIKADLGVDVGKIEERKIVKPEDVVHVEGALKGMKLSASNLYEGEGKVWDVALPSAEVGKRLKDVATGRTELSRQHIPDWYPGA